MNSLLFDFTVDKPNNAVFINREFAAELQLMWDVFTKQELLDRWWAPKPYESRTKAMNFEVGGRRFYSMVSPEGAEHWGTQRYTSITPTSNFKFLSSFTDKDENINTALPTSEWDLSFSEQKGTTKISIVIKHKTWAALETMIQMGFQGGFTMTLNYLETMLTEISGKK